MKSHAHSLSHSRRSRFLRHCWQFSISSSSVRTTWEFQSINLHVRIPREHTQGSSYLYVKWAFHRHKLLIIQTALLLWQPSAHSSKLQSLFWSSTVLLRNVELRWRTGNFLFVHIEALKIIGYFTEWIETNCDRRLYLWRYIWEFDGLD